MTTRRRGRRPLPAAERKGRLVQARVPEDLDETMRAEAKQKRVTVSQLISNVLEDTFNLVEHTIAEAASLGQTVKHRATDLGQTVKRDAQRLAASAKGVARQDGAQVSRGKAGELDVAERRALLDAVAAWQPVVINRAADCAQCGRQLERGANGLLSVGGAPDAPPVWLCQACARQL